jgi:predicted dinucleotide-binding enzyme
LQQKIKELEQQIAINETQRENKENFDNQILLSETNNCNTTKTRGATTDKRKRKSEVSEEVTVT